MGKLQIVDNPQDPNVGIKIDANKADISAGGGGQDGNIDLLDSGSNQRTSITTSQLVMKDASGKRRVLIDGPGGNLWLGGQDSPGDLMLFDQGESETLDHNKATVWISGQNSSLVMKDAAGKRRVLLDGPGGNLWLGGQGSPGDLMLFQGASDNANHNKATVWISGQNGALVMKDALWRRRVLLDGPGGNLWLGGQGEAGDLMLFDEGFSDNSDYNKATVRISGQNGSLLMKNAAGQRRVFLDGPGGNLWLGGQGQAGDLMLFDQDQSDNADHNKATVWISGQSGTIRSAAIVVKNGIGNDIIRLDQIPGSAPTSDTPDDLNLVLSTESRIIQ